MSTSSRVSKPAFKSKVSHPESLLDRHRSTQRKIDTLKAKNRLRESSRSTSAPKINDFSKRLVQKSENLNSMSRMERTQQMLSQSRFMPKNIKVSLTSLKDAETSEAAREQRVDNCFTVVSQRTDSPKFYPSLMQQSASSSNTKSQQLPDDIESRNKLLYSLREAAMAKGFHKEKTQPLDLKDINKRTQVWLMKKKSKIEEAKTLRDAKSKEGLTFKPFLRSRASLQLKSNTSRSNSSLCSEVASKRLKNSSRSSSTFGKLVKPNLSMMTSPRTFSGEDPYFNMRGYSKVTPIKMRLTYKHGYSNKLKKKFKPMIDYKDIRFKNNS